MSETKSVGFNPYACAVREYTADGVCVGRCWYTVVNGICPRHGNVKAVQEMFKETGKLTDSFKLKAESNP